MWGALVEDAILQGILPEGSDPEVVEEITVRVQEK